MCLFGGAYNFCFPPNIPPPNREAEKQVQMLKYLMYVSLALSVLFLVTGTILIIF